MINYGRIYSDIFRIATKINSRREQNKKLKKESFKAVQRYLEKNVRI